MKRYLIFSIISLMCMIAYSQTISTFTSEDEENCVDCDKKYGRYEESTSSSSSSTSDDDDSNTGISFSNNETFEDLYVPEPQQRELDNILWKKTVWRIIDLRDQSNFALYFPIEESNGRKNLFLTIFDLLKEGKINAYNYEETHEDFTEEAIIEFDKIMTDLDIDIYDMETNEDGKDVYNIDPSNIPVNRILMFYLKEIWYFDAMESCMKFKIEAIAPVYFDDSEENEVRRVLFWATFDELRPWLAQQPVVINNKNAIASISYDDLFQKRRFLGYIYKEDNIQNRSIIQYCNTPEEVRYEQNRIENEILNFEADLWEY